MTDRRSDSSVLLTIKEFEMLAQNQEEDSNENAIVDRSIDRASVYSHDDDDAGVVVLFPSRRTRKNYESPTVGKTHENN